MAAASSWVLRGVLFGRVFRIINQIRIFQRGAGIEGRRFASVSSRMVHADQAISTVRLAARLVKLGNISLLGGPYLLWQFSAQGRGKQAQITELRYV